MKKIEYPVTFSIILLLIAKLISILSSMNKYKENLILNLSFDFALAIIGYTELLETNRKFVISKQLLKAGTSIGANIREAQSSESLADFVHKMKIASKEISETEYWLQLCKYSKTYPYDDDLDDKLSNIAKITTKIITTAKTKLKTRQRTRIQSSH